MKLWRFLKYERPYLGWMLVCLLVVLAVLYTDPRIELRGDTLLYALILVLMCTGGFLVHRYSRTLRAIRRMNEEDAGNLSLEAEAYREALERMEKAHIRALNEVQAKQNEHYNYIVSWFHEIKTPISVLRLMQQTEVDPRSLEEEVSRIEHYVDQALYYAKLDSFNQDYEIVNCDLAQLAKDVVKQHAKTFISRKIRIRMLVDPTIVQSDLKWLQFILHQLITNSLKYTGEGGEVTLSTLVTQQDKQLIVLDNGIGIEPKDLPRIFNRGFTGTNGRVHMKSTGMGLYLAQELSNKLGHYITCESEAERFTKMIIHFPRNYDPFLETVGNTKPTT